MVPTLFLLKRLLQMRSQTSYCIESGYYREEFQIQYLPSDFIDAGSASYALAFAALFWLDAGGRWSCSKKLVDCCMSAAACSDGRRFSGFRCPLSETDVVAYRMDFHIGCIDLHSSSRVWKYLPAGCYVFPACSALFSCSLAPWIRLVVMACLDA